MTLQRGLIFSTKYTRWEKGWYYLIGSYQMGRKTHKTSNLSLEIEIIFILIFSFISVKDQSFKLIAFNTRLSLNKSRVIGHKMGSFSFADFRLILKKITEFVKKNDEDIYFLNLLDLDSVRFNVSLHFLRNDLDVLWLLLRNYLV